MRSIIFIYHAIIDFLFIATGLDRSKNKNIVIIYKVCFHLSGCMQSCYSLLCITTRNSSRHQEQAISTKACVADSIKTWVATLHSLCMLLVSGPGEALTNSWGCPSFRVWLLGSPDEDSFPSLGPLGLSIPAMIDGSTNINGYRQYWNAFCCSLICFYCLSEHY